MQKKRLVNWKSPLLMCPGGGNDFWSMKMPPYFNIHMTFYTLVWNVDCKSDNIFYFEAIFLLLSHIEWLNLKRSGYIMSIWYYHHSECGCMKKVFQILNNKQKVHTSNTHVFYVLIYFLWQLKCPLNWKKVWPWLSQSWCSPTVQG